MLKIIHNTEIVNINTLVVNDFNPKADIVELVKEGTEVQAIAEYNRLKKSIEIGGQDEPVAVRINEKDQIEIINGEHRYYAMKELGFKEVLVNNYGKISRQQAIGILLNHEVKFLVDPVLEAKLLQEWVTAGWPVDDLTYTAEEIEEKLKLIDFDWQSIMGKIPVVEFDEGEIDETREASGEYYMTLDKNGIEWLGKNFKRRFGKFALNGEKIVTILKNSLAIKND